LRLVQCKMKRVISILLTIIFLTSNVGVALATHYCGGKVFKQSIVFDGVQLNCGMEKSSNLSCVQFETTITDNCCKNEVQRFKIKDRYNDSTAKVILSAQFVKVFLASYIELVAFETKVHATYLHYNPPLPDRDISVLIQSFLI